MTLSIDSLRRAAKQLLLHGRFIICDHHSPLPATTSPPCLSASVRLQSRETPEVFCVVPAVEYRLG